MEGEAILDRYFEWGEVAVDPAVLEFVYLIYFPAALPGDAEAGVVEDEEEGGAGSEVVRGGGEGELGKFHVLERKNEGSACEVFFGEWEGFCGVGDEEGSSLFFFSFFDE
jgi:hypothetical protein